MQTDDLFTAEIETLESTTTPISLIQETPDERAMRVILDIMQARHVVVCAWSSGKDSTVLLSLVLQTACSMRARGEETPPIIVTHSDTGVENPYVTRLAKQEIAKIRAYGQRKGLDLTVLIGEPDLNASWATRVIGGRALPAFVNSRSDCSWDWKVLVQRRLLKQAREKALNLKDWNAPVVMTGVRLGESITRDSRIADRKEKQGLWTTDDGDLRASPILHHTSDDVWEHIGMVNAGVYESYSDFEATMELYKAGGGDGCVVVADMKMAGYSKPCSSRFGCWACTRIGPQDRSVQNMLGAGDGKYANLQPLNRLRNWIANTQYDWSLRQYVGRTISQDGYIEIGADTYSPDTLRKLLIYTLTAERLSGVPIISPEQLIAIDMRWSCYGLAPPFSALKTYFDVVDGGQWEEAPEVPMVPASEVPKIGRIHVGSSWYDATGLDHAVGLRDVALEMFSDSCDVGIKVLGNGAIVTAYDEGEKFSVDAEGATDFIGLMAQDYIAQYCHQEYPDWGEGVRIYLRMGIASIGEGQSRITDEILRRSYHRQLHNLHGQRSAQELKPRCDVLYARQADLF